MSVQPGEIWVSASGKEAVVVSVGESTVWYTIAEISTASPIRTDVWLATMTRKLGDYP